MDELTQKISEYLQQEQPDYWTGVKLYEKHPQAKRNVVVNLNDEGKYRKNFMHKKLIAELEKITGNQLTGRAAQLNASKASVDEPANLITDTNKEAPADYEYNVPYEELPEHLQNKVLQKGQYYDRLDALKKQMAELGPANNDKAQKQRRKLMTEMRNLSNSIKAIHQELIAYEENGEQQSEESEEEDKQPQSEKEFSYLTKEDRKLFMHLEAEEELERLEDFNNFKRQIPEMSEAELQNTLQKLRIKHSKQKKAADNAKKENTREKNAKELYITEAQINYVNDAYQSRQSTGEGSQQQNNNNEA